MIRRIILLVVNGLGLGALPDGAASRAVAADSLGALLASTPDLTLPNLETLGLGHIGSYPQLRRMDQPEGCFGRLAKQSPGSDTLTASWELAGIVQSEPVPSYQGGGLPDPVVNLIEQVGKRKVVVSRAEGPHEVLAKSGVQSIREKGLVVWGEAGGACQIAAHESCVSAKELFQIAKEVRTTGVGPALLWRVGARPFTGSSGAFRWLDQKRESCLPVPTKSLFDHVLGAEQLVTSFGKCGDLFNSAGFTRSIHVGTTSGAWADLERTLATTPRGLIVVNLFDDLEQVPWKDYSATMAEQLQGLDARLPDLQKKLKPEDFVCLTSDQGRDPRHDGSPTREYLPLVIFGPRLARGVNLGDRPTLADLGQTIAEAFDAARLSVGESFLQALRPS